MQEAHVAEKDPSASEILSLLHDSGTVAMIAELAKAIHILAVIPATSCSAERSFSSLRRLKTYLRNTCGQERLSSLALLHIETEFVNRVLTEDMEAMIDVFGDKHGRSAHFF